VKRLGILILLISAALGAQSNTGELRLTVTDPAGLGVKAAVEISNLASQYHNTLVTDGQGKLVAERLPYGVYSVHIRQPGFAEQTSSVEIRSVLPTEYAIKLTLASVEQSVAVNAEGGLLNPEQVGSISQIGSATIQDRLSSLPGRSMQDLVNSQPGWLYEGNAVLHPRGSEYQTQFVVDGIPLTDNRSPSFGPEIGADDVDSVSIYTAGFPAEYGRKMGGVVDVDTQRDTPPGFHGKAVLSGGSYGTAAGFVEVQDTWGLNTLTFSATGGGTGHYLNPVVIQNFTNWGTTGDFSARYERNFTPKDRLSVMVRHEFSRYQIPNEQVQQTFCYAPGQLTGPPCQRQDANNLETMGILSYTHIFSSHVVSQFSGMVRDNEINFNSNALSTPVELFQHNWFREGYFKGSVTVNHDRHELKVGVESDNIFLNENFRYAITDPSQYDPGTPLTFSFIANRPDLEQSAFIEDLIHLGNWTISAGLRWDHYQLILNRQAADPRFAISRYFPSAGLIVHFSYDRVFTTPSFENILLSSSTAATMLDPISLQLPVEPSEGNYYEVGLTKVFFQKFKLDANYFRRLVNNYADDDQIINTGISFPIAFRKAILYGAEAKIDLPDWNRFSGFLSYSYIVGNAWFPVTGGLFLGDDAVIPTSGHFPDSQDQRNTVRGRVRYQVAPRLWIAGGIQYDTGLPFDFQCPDGETMDQCIAGVTAQYGQKVIDRINFNRGRIFPSFQVNASLGADLYKSERVKVSLQLDGQNLTNVVDVIDFGGLFSGNAIGPARSWGIRLTTNF
jgi:Carboxypeptidase regulatory-like domain/TonB-dependent Receptor Plug Domain